VGDLESLIKQVQRLTDAREMALGFQGANVFGFLKGEQGVHRRNELKPSGERSQSLVKVWVESPGLWDAETWLAIRADEGEEPEAQPAPEKGKPAQKGKSGPGQAEELAVIRTYQFDGERSVRDLRTGVRISQVSALLDGELDEFILAYLRDEEAKQAWGMEQS
jgi:protein subunit release factor B